MSKTFTINPIANELKGSAWFRRPEEGAPPAATASETPLATEPQKRSPEHTAPKTVPVDRTNRSAVQQPKKTRTLRRAYDLTETQLTGLRRIRATRELSRDAHVSMSELVREAIDLLLAKEGIQ
jgi:hypothetical protein